MKIIPNNNYGYSDQPQEGSRTPWGLVQGIKVLAPGLVSVWTASHGGIWVAPQLRERIEGHKRTAFYEEDCEWAKVHAAYPSAFPDECAKHGPETLKRYFPNWDQTGLSDMTIKEISLFYSKRSLPPMQRTGLSR